MVFKELSIKRDLGKPVSEQIAYFVRSKIRSREIKAGAKLPTTHEIMEEIGVGSDTVRQAIQSLKNDGLVRPIPGLGTIVNELESAGMVERKIGSETFVSFRKPETGSLTFGLMIPGLGETEMFEPICAHMSHYAESNNCNLLLGSTVDADAEKRKEHIKKLVARNIEQKVDGVFFAPLELTADKDAVNKWVVDSFEKAGIPVVLLDRDIEQFPSRSKCDLVGIDNIALGCTMTNYLLGHGFKNILFFAKPLSAPSVNMRIAGYLQALAVTRVDFKADWVHWCDPEDLEGVNNIFQKIERGKTAVMCANDTTAAALMHTLDELGFNMPEDLSLVGVDDIRYAAHLRVPLTSYRQPSSDFAKIAIDTMLSRILNPELPARSVYLTGEVVERRSVVKCR